MPLLSNKGQFGVKFMNFVKTNLNQVKTNSALVVLAILMGFIVSVVAQSFIYLAKNIIATLKINNENSIFSISIFDNSINMIPFLSFLFACVPSCLPPILISSSLKTGSPRLRTIIPSLRVFNCCPRSFLED